MKIFFLLATLNLGLLTSNCFSQNKNIDSLLTLLKEDAPDTNKVNHLCRLIRECESVGDYEKGLHYGTEAQELADKLHFKKGLAELNNCIGFIYLRQGGNYPLALEYFLKALKLNEELKYKKGAARALGNIGILYSQQGDYTKSLENHFKSLKISEELADKGGVASSFNNIGVAYFNHGNFSKALEYDLKGLEMAKKLGNKNMIGRNLNNIGEIYDHSANYLLAFDYYSNALKLAEEITDKKLQVTCLINIGQLYIESGKFKKAEQSLKRANILSKSIGVMDRLMESEESLSKLYDTMGRYKEALIQYKKSIALKDTIFSQENKKQLVRKEMNYEFEKKEAATKAENEKQQAVAVAESKKQKIIIWSVIAGLLLVIVFAGFVFRSLRITRKQKNIIELQKNEVLRQKEIVVKQKEKITDSITYAQRIQQSILMEESEIQNFFPESFIFFQPKDIVSGDFYWFSKLEDKIIIAAVDCTGHGVPGAFMSMIGNTLLNQIVNEKQITKPAEILKQLNLGIYEALHQKKDGALSDDGMDIALCLIDYKNNELQYAGAQNPLYIVSNGELEVIKADLQGIGGNALFSKQQDPLKKEFATQVIPIKKDMNIYLFSDGYMDQFGGKERKKFGMQKFKEILLNNEHLPMSKQKKLIESDYIEWKGSIPQIDDVLVIGIKI